MKLMRFQTLWQVGVGCGSLPYSWWCMWCSNALGNASRVFDMMTMMTMMMMMMMISVVHTNGAPVCVDQCLDTEHASCSKQTNYPFCIWCKVSLVVVFLFDCMMRRAVLSQQYSSSTNYLQKLVPKYVYDLGHVKSSIPIFREAFRLQTFCTSCSRNKCSDNTD
eukprot:3204001-Amphidinium_carterae.1